MPIVSDLRNPPMNWGYPRTWEGFKHAIQRGQYEAIGFQIPSWGQITNYFEDVRVQYPEQQMREIRAFIEVVKQQPEIPEESIEAFHAFLESAPVSDVVLGCTELPVLYQSIVQNGLPLSVRIFDPLEEAIRVLQQQIS